MLNDQARAVYDYIRLRTETDIPPSVREICAALGMKSTSTAHRYINLLVADGYLEKSGNQNRGIRLAGGRPLRIPVVSRLDGIPEQAESYVAFYPLPQGDTRYVAWRMPDETGLAYGIQPGDLLVIGLGAPPAPDMLLVCAAEGEPVLTRDTTGDCVGFVAAVWRSMLPAQNFFSEPLDKAEGT